MINKNLAAASAKPLILTILNDRKSYGYEIIKQVKELSGGKIAWKDGMLYPVLYQLEKNSLVKSKYLLIEETGKARKYYTLTKAGKKELEKHKAEWVHVSDMLYRLWGMGTGRLDTG